VEYFHTILIFYIWAINFSGSSQYCFLPRLNDSTVVEVLDTDSTNRTSPLTLPEAVLNRSLHLFGVTGFFFPSQEADNPSGQQSLYVFIHLL